MGSDTPPLWEERTCMNYLKFFFMSHLLILPVYLFIFKNFFVSVWTHGYLFYTWDFNLMMLYLICCSNLTTLAIGGFFIWGPMSLGQLAIIVKFFFFFFNSSSLSATIRCFRHISDTFCPCPRISYFFNELWFLLLSGMRSWDLNPRCFPCCWCVLVSRPFRMADEGKTCVY